MQIRDAILNALAVSTPDQSGLSYADVLARVRKRFPKAKTSLADIRWNAYQCRNRVEGFDHVTIPTKRPHSSKGRKRP